MRTRRSNLAAVILAAVALTGASVAAYSAHNHPAHSTSVVTTTPTAGDKPSSSTSTDATASISASDIKIKAACRPASTSPAVVGATILNWDNQQALSNAGFHYQDPGSSSPQASPSIKLERWRNDCLVLVITADPDYPGLVMIGVTPNSSQTSFVCTPAIFHQASGGVPPLVITTLPGALQDAFNWLNGQRPVRSFCQYTNAAIA